MKRYGLRIGNVGVEFISRDERQKALINFTSGTSVSIQDTGIRYVDDKGAFSTYERDDKDVMVNCEVCHGVFGSDACPTRDYPFKNSWEKEYGEKTGSVCDACFESQRKAKELLAAQKIVNAAKEG